MATTSNLSSIIRYYAEKTKSPFIDFKEFCSYIKKYAERHVEEQGELVKYLGNPISTVTAEIQGLTEKKLVALIDANNKKLIVSIPFFSVQFVNQYKKILDNNTLFFPLLTDLPKQFPNTLLERKEASFYIPSIIDKEETNSPLLYVLNFSDDIPAMLLPAAIPLHILLKVSQQKVRKVLKKEEFHDYFLKKIRSTNPTKEISIRNFYTTFVDVENFQYTEFSEGDDYYLWNQLLYYIRQDFTKIQDKTLEDINVLQSVNILEIYSTYLKEKIQQKQRREEALRDLENNLAKSPYFFSMNQILKFQDQNGKLLYGKFSEEDLKDFLQRMTTEGQSNELPPLLVFKVESGTRYYVYKQKVLQVVVRLCNEAHEEIARHLEDDWLKSLLDYETLPEMTNLSEFENVLYNLVQEKSPVLFALLNANFMSVLAYEVDSIEGNQGFHIFVNGKIMPYSELLMLNHKKIYANAKSRLPFIYTIPILSFLIGLFSGKIKKKNKQQKKIDNSNKIVDFSDDDGSTKKTSEKTVSKQEALSKQAKDLAKQLVPEGSTVDRELNYLIKQWNRMISKDAFNNLTEDVNSLIRDYTRRVVRTISASSFTKERVENLAKTLVNTPNMQKIGEDKALTEYVILYIVRLVSN